MINRLLMTLACVLFSVSVSAAGANSKIHPSLADVFGTKGDAATVRVIVSLDAAQPRGMNRARAIAAAQDRVVDAFRNENNGKGLAVRTRYQTLFGFSAELTRGQANALAKRGDVTFIEEMPIHYKSFTESHPLTFVDLAQDTYDGTGSVIAIIDDGIDDSHPAFTGKLLGGYDFADNDNDPTIDCTSQSHGTAVAGVALGNSTSPPVLGVAPGAEMVFLKIQGASICGSASLDGDIVGAIDWATANKETYGIDIISMSLGGGLYSSESSCDGSSAIYLSAVQNAVNAGITVIAASGNDGMCDSMSRPACFSDVVSVGAVYDDAMGVFGWCVDRNSCANTERNMGCSTRTAVFENTLADNVIAYSNSASFLDVAAPATCAKSAAPDNGSNGAWTDCFGGTSSATPFTSGVAALAVEAAGKGVLSPADMLDVLVVSGDSVTDPKNGRISPRVNGVNATLEAETYDGGTPTNNPPTANFSFLCSFLDCDFTDSSSDSDGTVTAWSWDFGGDGSSTAQNPSHTFSAAGTYAVTLTVTDDDSATDNTTKSVTVTEQQVNQPPTAAFTFSCNDLSCSFTDQSSDDNGITSWSWSFGDNGSSTAQNPSHTYASAGTYTVSLTVGDGEFSDSTSQQVTVTEPGIIEVDLAGRSIVSRNKWTAEVEDLNGNALAGTWSVAGTASCTGSICTLSGLHIRKVLSVTFTETITGNGESIVVNQN